MEMRISERKYMHGMAKREAPNPENRANSPNPLAHALGGGSFFTPLGIQQVGVVPKHF